MSGGTLVINNNKTKLKRKQRHIFQLPYFLHRAHTRRTFARFSLNMTYFTPQTSDKGGMLIIAEMDILLMFNIATTYFRDAPLPPAKLKTHPGISPALNYKF